jgi:hypothetical protein
MERDQPRIHEWKDNCHEYTNGRKEMDENATNGRN